MMNQSNNNAALLELRLNGIKIPDFDPAVPEYDHVLPCRHRSVSIPEVEYVPASVDASVKVSKPKRIPGDIEIRVTASGGESRTYTLHLSKSDVPEKISRTTSWLGNTFSGAGTVQDGAWVQNAIDAMVVTPDGTCYTHSEWDEGGRTHGIYKEGKCIGNKDMGIDSTRAESPIDHSVWYIREKTVCKEGAAARITDVEAPAALAFSTDGELMIADNARHQILFYDVSSDTPREVKAFGERGGVSSNTPGLAAGEIYPTRFWNMTGIGMDAAGRIYVAMCFRYTVTCIRCLTPDGKQVWSVESAAFVDAYDFDPTTDGRDIYGLTEHYVMDYSKTEPGTEQKLHAYTLDTDRYPNDPRALFGFNILCSVWIRYIQGQKIMFSTGMFPDGMFIWRFDGEIAVPCGILAKKTLREGENAIPCQPDVQDRSIIWYDRNGDGQYQPDEFHVVEKLTDTGGFGWDVDRNGNVWRNCGNNRIVQYKVGGLDSFGSPVYTEENMEVYTLPDTWQEVRRVQYDASADSLYISGYETDDPYEGQLWGNMGRVLYRYDNWSDGNPVVHENYPIRLAYFHYVSDSFSAQGFNIGAQSFYVDEDRIFLTYGARGPLGYKTGEMHVYDSNTAEELGCITPGAVVGGYTEVGWVDIPQAVKAKRLSDGTFKVLIEEDYRARQLLYTVTPYNGIPETDGEVCPENGYVVTAFRKEAAEDEEAFYTKLFRNPLGKLEKQTGSEEDENTITFSTGWDPEYLYTAVHVTDAHVHGSPDSPHWENDAIEIFIDGDNDKAGSYNEYDVQYIISWNKDTLFSSSNAKADGVRWRIYKTEDGYEVRAAVPWKTLQVVPEKGLKIGFDVTNDDRRREDGGRFGCLTWAGDGGNCQSTEKFGTVILG